ncbi:MAG: kinase [Candidatus Liptonbacteria bacterium]|nr:kinase [Candidatus Liptonbacteria bacterium]
MVISKTPFRISFFGGGTDYPVWYNENGGAVLSTTIDKYCYITCRYLPPFFAHKSRIVWSKIEAVKNVDEIEHPSARAIIKHLNIKDGLEIHHDADLPARSGLGASSSFTVGLLSALHALRGKSPNKKDLALEAIHVEQNIMKENVGAQDQAAAAFGGLNKIEFGMPHVVSVSPVTVSAKKLGSLQDHLLLVFTGLARSASEVAAEQIKNTKQKTEELKAMRQLVDEAVGILGAPTDNLDDFGRLLHETWLLKRGLSSKITNSTVDSVYDSAMKAGALGGKLLGAGGGGFMLFFADPEKHAHIKEEIGDFLKVPFRFENAGSQIIYRAEPHYES